MIIGVAFYIHIFITAQNRLIFVNTRPDIKRYFLATYEIYEEELKISKNSV